MTNDHGVLLDKNGYAPSIVQEDNTRCWQCGLSGPLQRHEIFGASNRQKSKADGLWVCLCPECHQFSPLAVHRCFASAEKLKKAGERAAMIRYGWTVLDFRERYGKNYLELEELP